MAVATIPSAHLPQHFVCTSMVLLLSAAVLNRLCFELCENALQLLWLMSAKRQDACAGETLRLGSEVHFAVGLRKPTRNLTCKSCCSRSAHGSDAGARRRKRCACVIKNNEDAWRVHPIEHMHQAPLQTEPSAIKALTLGLRNHLSHKQNTHHCPTHRGPSPIPKQSESCIYRLFCIVHELTRLVSWRRCRSAG